MSITCDDDFTFLLLMGFKYEQQLLQINELGWLVTAYYSPR